VTVDHVGFREFIFLDLIQAIKGQLTDSRQTLPWNWFRAARHTGLMIEEINSLPLRSRHWELDGHAAFLTFRMKGNQSGVMILLISVPRLGKPGE